MVGDGHHIPVRVEVADDQTCLWLGDIQIRAGRLTLRGNGLAISSGVPNASGSLVICREPIDPHGTADGPKTTAGARMIHVLGGTPGGGPDAGVPERHGPAAAAQQPHAHGVRFWIDFYTLLNTANTNTRTSAPAATTAARLRDACHPRPETLEKMQAATPNITGSDAMRIEK